MFFLYNDNEGKCHMYTYKNSSLDQNFYICLLISKYVRENIYTAIHAYHSFVENSDILLSLDINMFVLDFKKRRSILSRLFYVIGLIGRKSLNQNIIQKKKPIVKRSVGN